MLVFTAIVAPRAVIVELLDVLRSVFAPSQTVAPAKRSFAKRLAGKPARAVAPPPSPYDPEQARAQIDDLYLPVAKLGNLTKGDLSRRLLPYERPWPPWRNRR